MYNSEPDDALNCSLQLKAALFIPNALATPFAFEKTNCLSLIGIEKSMGLLKGGRARRAVEKPIWRLSIMSHFYRIDVESKSDPILSGPIS